MGWTDMSDVIFNRNIAKIHMNAEKFDVKQLKNNIPKYLEFFSKLSSKDCLIYINKKIEEDYDHISKLIKYADEENESILVGILGMYLDEKPNLLNTIIKKLLDLGANINAKNENGDTALNIVTYNNDTELSRFLIENGADVTCVNKKNESPIEFAIFNDNREIFELLLKKNIQLDFLLSSGESVIENLIHNEKLDLLENMDNPNIFDSVQNIPVNLKMIDELINAGKTDMAALLTKKFL